VQNDDARVAEGSGAMTKFRSKPIVIEAKRWNGSQGSAKEIEEWSYGCCVPATPRLTYYLFVDTPEVSMRANPGDRIIKGTEGEFYPCKAHIFETKYEAVE
jgi:hypothetical protein